MNGTVVAYRDEWKNLRTDACRVSLHESGDMLMIFGVGPYDVTVFAVPEPLTVVIQDERLDEATEEAYTTYSKEDLAAALLRSTPYTDDKEHAALLGLLAYSRCCATGLAPRRG